MIKKIESNLWKYTLLLITCKRVFAAILGAYYLTIPEVTPQIIGVILLVGNFSSFLLEIPSGYLSDKIGHKQTLVISRIFALISTLLFLFANNLIFLIFATIFLGASTSFNSGTRSAFLHETLRALDKEDDFTKIAGKINSITFSIPIVFMVLVPFLVGISYKIPFLLALFLDVVGFFTASSLIIPPVSQGHTEEVNRKNFRQVLKEGKYSGFFTLALFSGVVSGLLIVVAGFRAPYQVFIGVPVIWFGVLFGLGRGLASVILAYSGKIKKHFNFFSFYRFQIIIYAIIIFSLGLISTQWIILTLFIIINAFQWGLSKVDEGYLLDVIKHNKFKATLLSIRSQIDNIFAGVFSLLAGLVIERSSYGYGFLFLGVSFLIILMPLYFYILKSKK